MSRVMPKRLVWPPKVGSRVHLNSGHEHNSWSGEVRAVVDEDYAVIKRWLKHKGWHRYEILERLTVETFNRNKDDDRFGFFEGPLPKEHAWRTGEH